MKFEYTKWPVTITYEVADDWFDGIDNDRNRTKGILEKAVIEQAETDSKSLVEVRGQILAQQEAKLKQNKP